MVQSMLKIKIFCAILSYFLDSSHVFCSFFTILVRGGDRRSYCLPVHIISFASQKSFLVILPPYRHQSFCRRVNTVKLSSLGFFYLDRAFSVFYIHIICKFISSCSLVTSIKHCLCLHLYHL